MLPATGSFIIIEEMRAKVNPLCAFLFSNPDRPARQKRLPCARLLMYNKSYIFKLGRMEIPRRPHHDDQAFLHRAQYVLYILLYADPLTYRQTVTYGVMHE